ncbi:hypothetical protein Vretimale_2887, partial [Volvox reticuliferus]
PWPAMPCNKGPRQTLLWMGPPRSATSLAPAMPAESCEPWNGLRSRLQRVLLGISKTGSLQTLSHSSTQPHASVDILLFPMELGSQLVGALLWAQPSHAVAPAPATVAATVAAEWHVQAHLHVAVENTGTKTPAVKVVKAVTGGGLRDGGSGGDGGQHCEPAQLVFSQVAMRAVAGVLVDCLVAPHLRSLQQVCAAAHLLAHASDVCALASVLSSAVSEALRSELHVELQVKVAMGAVAVATSATGGGGGATAPLNYGFMLQMRPPSTLTQTQIPA